MGLHDAGPGGEFVGDFGFEVERLVGDGVGEAEFPSVEEETRGFDELTLGLGVDGVAEDGGLQGFAHVDAELVGAAGEEMAFDEGAAAVDAA